MTKLSPRWRRIAQMFLGTGILQAANIITFILLARIFTPEVYGTYRQLFLINQIVWAIVFSALPTALLYFCGKTKSAGEVAAVVRSHLMIVVIAAFGVAAVLMFVAGGAAHALNNPALERLLPYFALFPAAYIVSSLLPSVLVVSDRTSLLPVLTGTTAIVTSGSTLTAAWFFRDLDLVVIVATIAAVTSAVFVGVVIIQLSRNPDRFNLPIRSILIYAAPLLLASALGIVGLRMDQMVVSRVFGPAIFAIYAIGAFELPIYSLIKSSSSSVILPELSRAVKSARWGEVLDIWHDLLRKNAALLFPISAGLFVFSEEFITLLFGERYRTAAPIFAIFTLLGPIRAVTFGLILRAMGRTKAELIGSAYFLAVITAVLYFAANWLSIVGVATVVVVTTISLAVVMLFLTFRASNREIGIFDLYPVRLIIGFAILVGGFVAVHAIIGNFPVGNIGKILLLIPVVTGVTYALLRNQFLLVPARVTSVDGNRAC